MLSRPIILVNSKILILIQNFHVLGHMSSAGIKPKFFKKIILNNIINFYVV